MVMIDDNYGLYTNEYNFILIRNPKYNTNETKWRGKKSFFPNLEMLFKHYLRQKSKDSIGSNLNKYPVIENIQALTNRISLDLSELFKDIKMQKK